MRLLVKKLSFSFGLHLCILFRRIGYTCSLLRAIALK